MIPVDYPFKEIIVLFACSKPAMCFASETDTNRYLENVFSANTRTLEEAMTAYEQNQGIIFKKNGKSATLGEPRLRKDVF